MTRIAPPLPPTEMHCAHRMQRLSPSHRFFLARGLRAFLIARRVPRSASAGPRRISHRLCRAGRGRVASGDAVSRIALRRHVLGSVPLMGPVPTEIRTERLVLRPFRAVDVEDALAYRDDREFARFLPHIPQPFTRRDAEEFVATNMSEPWERSPTFAVVLDGRVIGTVNFEVDAPSRTARMGYAIGRAWWGRGLATEAARAAMDWAIGAFDLVRVGASTDLRNVRSQRVLEKLGMIREAVRVADHIGRDGTAVDEVVYAFDVAGVSASPRNIGRLRP